MLKFEDINIKNAKSFKERFMGLMFKKNVHYGFLFEHCRSIHTFFMFDEIDVVATDNNDKIIKIYKCVKPWHIIIAPLGTKKIYELPKKTL